MLAAGALTLTSLCLLCPHLTEANHRDVLARAQHRSKREVEEIVASLRPRPDAPPILRRLPDRAMTQPPNPQPAEATESPLLPPPLSTVLPSAAAARRPAPPAIVEPLAPERYKLQVTISRATREKLRRAADLMRHAVPSGDFALIIELAGANGFPPDLDDLTKQCRTESSWINQAAWIPGPFWNRHVAWSDTCERRLANEEPSSAIGP